MQSQITGIDYEATPLFTESPYQSGAPNVNLLQIGQRMIAVITESAESDDKDKAMRLTVKREVIRLCSFIHLEEFAEYGSTCVLKYSMALTESCKERAQDEIQCILLLLDAETQRFAADFDLSA